MNLNIPNDGLHSAGNQKELLQFVPCFLINPHACAAK